MLAALILFLIGIFLIFASPILGPRHSADPAVDLRLRPRPTRPRHRRGLQRRLDQDLPRLPFEDPIGSFGLQPLQMPIRRRRGPTP
jgi:hypothetical protein